MSLFKNLGNFISTFKDAVKAGSDFNPLLKEVMDGIEQLHTEGKLDDVLYQAEQSYEQEHEGYQAKGTHTNALDSKRDVNELNHFMQALSNAQSITPELKEKVDHLLEMKEDMQKALGPFASMI